ncbi:MAG: dienelactone hydrolase family protein [Deltaproteobacteria bacterium]|nr:dienelactone hydrolase family protein [Deltaproteobacteria bacterium]
MRISNSLYLILLLTLSVSVSEAQLRKRKGDVNGNLRLEVITVPEHIAADFKRLNPKALLYHPIKKEKEKNPLVIFLHGSGGSKRSIERFKWTGGVKEFISPKEGRPIVHILVPQSKGEWDPASLNKMLDFIIETNPAIDTNRIYCIGYSMGGKGTWEWAMASPERFAAIIPKAFIPDLSGIERMTQLPIWAMVGTKDSRPRVEGIRAMEKALKELGSTVVRTTFFEGANHASAAGEAKKLEGVYDWLFSHSLPR